MLYVIIITINTVFYIFLLSLLHNAPFLFLMFIFFPLKKGDIKLVSGGAKNEDKCISFHILHLSDPVQSTYYLEWTRAVSRHCFFLIVSSVQQKKNSCYFCT